MERIFNENELVPSSVELVFRQEQLTIAMEQITVFPVSAEDQSSQHRTNILFCIVQKLFVWNRYTHRLWRYFMT